MNFLILLLLVESAVGLAPMYRIKEAIPDRYIVKVKEGVDVSNVLNRVYFYSTFDDRNSVLKTFGRVFNGFAATMTNDVLSKILNLDEVQFVEEDGIVKIEETASIPWSLDRIDQTTLPLDDTYTPVGDGTGVNVYMLDTGIYRNHAEFAGRAVQLDDALGTNGLDCHGHGTHCAGLIGGKTYGVAKNVSLHSIRCLDCFGTGSSTDVLTACEWLVENGVKPAVASMSFGASTSLSIDMGVQAIIAAGVQVTAAAGNGNENACNRSPARVQDVITVGAVDSNDARASFSNFGTCVDIFAPGVGIRSAWIGNQNATSTNSGTSYAAPLVAGALAILLEIDENQGAAELKSNLQKKAIADAVTDPLPGSPNLLLYVGPGNGGGSVPTQPPSSAACGSVMTSEGSIITSPNFPNMYDNNELCDYNVVTPSSELAVMITFSFFEVESATGCVYDSLKVYDGASTSAEIIATLCGDTLPNTIYSSGSNVYLEFSSDDDVTKTGFEATVSFIDVSRIPTNPPIPPSLPVSTAAPCVYHVTEEGSMITSPGFPKDYGVDQFCQYYMYAPVGEVVKLTFVEFSVEYEDNCGYDSVMVFDGDSSTDPFLRIFCGDDIPRPVYSSGQYMYVEFHSDESYTMLGFEAVVSFTDRANLPTVLPTSSTGCGSFHTEPSGTLTTPNYPDPYNNNVDCTATILSSDRSKRVTLTIEALDMEDSVYCNFDYVAVYDGINSSADLIGQYCGTNPPPPITATGPDMHIIFHSDSSVSGSGTIASYIIHD